MSTLLLQSIVQRAMETVINSKTLLNGQASYPDLSAKVDDQERLW
jgi:hypothetical protein